MNRWAIRMTILWVIHREKRFSSSRTVGILTDGVWAKEMGHRRDFFPYLGGAKHLDLCFFVVTAQRSIVKHGDGPIPIPTEWGDDPHFGVGSKLSFSNSSRFIFPLRPDTWQGHCCEIPVPCSRVTAVAYQNDSHDADDDNDGDDEDDVTMTRVVMMIKRMTMIMMMTIMTLMMRLIMQQSSY